MPLIKMFLLVLALVCFLLAMVKVGHPRLDLIAAGLAAGTLSLLVP